MQLNSNILNNRYNSAVSKQNNTSFDFSKKKGQNNAAVMGDLSFKGIREDAVNTARTAATRHSQEFFETAREIFARKGADEASGFFSGNLNKIGTFFREQVFNGVDVTYKHGSFIEDELKKSFGSAFDDCFEAIDSYTRTINRHEFTSGGNVFQRMAKNHRDGWIEPIVFRKDPYEDTVTFHKDPFIRNVCKGIKDFTVGQFLDFCCAARNIFRKADTCIGTGDIIAPMDRKHNFFNDILDRHEAEKRARDAFYKLAGVFESASEGVENVAAKHLTPDAGRLENDTKETIRNNIRKLAQDSIEKASKKVGKYNTKSERAWNRLGTGLVSAIFASNDYYNESIYANNDHKKAAEAGRGRFKQDMSKQLITATLTYVVLGAFQNKVNKSIPYAVLSLGGVTIISEILSRVLRGIPLKPLSPEEARLMADKEDRKRAEKEKTEIPQNVQQNEPPKETEPAASISTTTEDNTTSVSSNNNMDVFNVFTSKINDTSAQNTNPSFRANAETKKNTQGEEKKSKNIALIALKCFLGAVGLSLGVGFIRSRNILNIDTGLKSISKFFERTGKKLTERHVIMPKDDVDGLLKYMNKNGFTEQYDKLRKTLEDNIEHGAMNGQSSIVRKYMPKKEINPNGLYYDLGTVESKGRRTALNIITYPVNTVCKLIKGGNNLIKGMFGVKAEKAADNNSSLEKTISFVETYATKFRDAQNKGLENSSFKEELTQALIGPFSEAQSKNKNTSVAMLSRFLITIISGYFFVNDYRNRSLIESRGEDLERANAVRNERIGHKIFNFFFNSMFMDLFNTTFEPIYLGSVVGATAVAMATEVTNETAVRASICNPTKRMTRDEIIEYEKERLNDPGLKGKYYKAFMKLTGKKPISEKAKKQKN